MGAVSIHLPEIIRGYIPSSFNAVTEIVKNLPDFLPHIVLTTMSCNVILLEFARSVWRLSMRWSDIIIQVLWGFILICPILPLDADTFVTPWFGSRLFSLIMFVPIFIFGSIILTIITLPLALIFGLIGLVLITVYELAMVSGAFIGLMTSCCSSLLSILQLISLLPYAGPALASMVTILSNTINALGVMASLIGTLTTAIIPVLLLPVTLLILLPVLILVGGMLILGLIYFAFYLLQIAIGVAMMVISLPLQAVFYVLLALCGNVPVLGTVLGLCRTFTSFYAFCIPPNFIEVITQTLPLCVNTLASLPAVTLMPISLTTTFMSAIQSLIYAIPSIPGYALRLGNRFIFSLIAEAIAIVSLVIDAIAAIILIIFALCSSLLFECLNLSILESMPQIMVLSLALMCVTCASVLDIFGIIVLRLPDMISEYAYSVLKSSAMLPVLSSIIPSIPAAPAMLQPEVIIEGISMIAMGILLLPLAIPGALMALAYNLIMWLIRTLYRISPRIVTLPLDLTRRCFSTLDNLISGITSTLSGAASRIEAGVQPYA
jgi:hypothetical protein